MTDQSVSSFCDKLIHDVIIHQYFIGIKFALLQN